MLESLALSRRSLLYFFLVSLIFLSVFYYESAIAAGRDFPGPSIEHHVARLTLRSGEMYKICGYMILSRGDKVSFDIVISRTPWLLNITVYDLLNEESYGFSQVYYTLRAPTPEFIAPHTSLYYYEVVAGYLGNESYDVSFTLAGSQTIRYDTISRIPFFILIVVALIIIVELTSKKLLVSSRVINLFRWEFLSMNTWVFYILTLYTYSLFFVTFPATISPCARPYIAVYEPIAFYYRSSYLIVYTLLAATCVNTIFAYNRETRFERIMDFLPLTRRKRFLIRLLAIFTALYFPLVVGSFMIYVIWIPDLIVKKPVLFLQAYLSTLFHYLIVFFAVITYTLLPAIVFSRISLSLMLSALPPIVLYLYSDAIPRDLYILNLRSLIIDAPYWFLLEVLPNPHKYVRSLSDLLYLITTRMGPAITFIPGFIVVLNVSYIIYSRRESP